MLTRPRWVDFGTADLARLRYLWDDARADDDFSADTSEILAAALRMNTRARLVLLVGLYEWVVWRFEGLHANPEPEQILEAAWCATVDPRYLAFYELDREDWIGPVQGPLWCALAYVQHGLPEGHRFPKDLFDAIAFIYQLLMHVLPKPDRFVEWVVRTLKRLTSACPEQPEDPFEDVFDHDLGARLGPVIGRGVLDPDMPMDSIRDRQFLGAILAASQASANPFLATPDDLEEAGFEGVPYSMPN